MKKSIWTGTFGAIVGAAAIAAFAQAPQQSSSAAQSASASQRVTITGCLKPAPARPTDSGAAGSTAGTTGSGTANSAQDNEQYVLENATLSPAAADQQGAATGAAGSSGAAAGSTGSATGSATGTTGSATGSATGTTGSATGSASGAAGTSGAAGSAATPPASSASGAAQPAQTYRLLVKSSALTPHVGKKLELTGTIVNDPAYTSANASNEPLLRVEAGKVVAASCEQ